MPRSPARVERPSVMTFAAALQAARTRAALTRAEVARRAGVALESYGRLERGVMYPSIPTLRRLCRALGIASDELLGLGSRTPLPLGRLVSATRGLTASQLRMLSLLAESLHAPPRG